MFDLILICDEERIFEGKVKEVKIITSNGPVVILDQHQPYMSKIEKSVTYIKEDDSINDVEIFEGFIYTNGKVCFVVVDAGLRRRSHV